jgi:hypothetical protein
MVMMGPPICSHRSDEMDHGDARRRAPRCMVVLMAALLVVGQASGSWAAPSESDDAGSLFEDGVNLYKSGQYGKALLRLEAYRVGGGTIDPGVWWMMARCHHQLGHRKEALVNYYLFMAKAPDHPKFGQAKKLADQLEQELPPEQRTDHQLAATPVGPPSIPTSSSSSVAAPTAPAPQAESPAAAEPKVSRPVLPWVVGGCGVLVAGVGTWLAATGRNDYDQARRDYSAGRVEEDAVSQARRDGNLQIGLAWGAIGVGAAALGLAGWWLLSDEREPSPQALLLPLPSGDGLLGSWVFAW